MEMVGERIKMFRQKRGLSITKLAMLADTSKSYLSNLERGIQSNPSLGFLKKVAQTLDTTVELLIENTEIANEPDYEIDEEWKSLIQEAIYAGLTKEEFDEFLRYKLFKNWKEQGILTTYPALRKM